MKKTITKADIIERIVYVDMNGCNNYLTDLIKGIYNISITELLKNSFLGIKSENNFQKYLSKNSEFIINKLESLLSEFKGLEEFFNDIYNKDVDKLTEKEIEELITYIYINKINPFGSTLTVDIFLKLKDSMKGYLVITSIVEFKKDMEMIKNALNAIYADKTLMKQCNALLKEK